MHVQEYGFAVGRVHLVSTGNWCAVWVFTGIVYCRGNISAGNDRTLEHNIVLRTMCISPILNTAASEAPHRAPIAIVLALHNDVIIPTSGPGAQGKR